MSFDKSRCLVTKSEEQQTLIIISEESITVSQNSEFYNNIMKHLQKSFLVILVAKTLIFTTGYSFLVSLNGISTIINISR